MKSQPCNTTSQAEKDRDALLEAIRITLEENAHLADGYNCTLLTLKLAYEAATAHNPSTGLVPASLDC